MVPAVIVSPAARLDVGVVSVGVAKSMDFLLALVNPAEIGTVNRILRE
jgi:hypothetical protein